MRLSTQGTNHWQNAGIIGSQLVCSRLSDKRFYIITSIHHMTLQNGMTGAF